mgnify:FL=1
MEQPEIFTPAAYHELLASLQPVYGLTAGLTNKMVSKAVAQVLERCAPAQDYLPEKSVPGMNSVNQLCPP